MRAEPKEKVSPSIIYLPNRGLEDIRDSAGVGDYSGTIVGPDQYRGLDGVVRKLL